MSKVCCCWGIPNGANRSTINDGRRNTSIYPDCGIRGRNPACSSEIDPSLTGLYATLDSRYNVLGNLCTAGGPVDDILHRGPNVDKVLESSYLVGILRYAEFVTSSCER